MKNVVFIIFTCLLLSCASKKQSKPIDFENYTVLSKCPSEGNCKFSVLKNKSLTIKTSGNGSMYYQLTDRSGSMVIKYVYDKKTNPAYADGNYREEFLIETDETFSNLKGGNPGIKKIIGLHCFCKGKAGYYIVDDAVIQYKNSVLKFTVPAVAEGQVITEAEVGFR